MVSILDEYAENMVLKLDSIKVICGVTFNKYNVDAAYLFGSYAKDNAKGDSDIDIMIVSSVDGIEYYELVAELEENLRKKVDLIRLEAAVQNIKLLNEILKDGIKIYG